MTLDEAIAAWDRDAYRAGIGAAADRQRAAILAAFPEADWPSLPLARYAIGTGADGTFSWHLEFGGTDLGSIKGGFSHKFLIFYKAAEKSWVYPTAHPSVEAAWDALRADLCRAFAAARADRIEELREIPSLQNGSPAIAKAVSVYAPDALFPAFSQRHREHWAQVLGITLPGTTAWEGCRALRDIVRADPRFDGWSMNEAMRLLYAWRHPGPDPAATTPGGAAEVPGTPAAGGPRAPDPLWRELAAALDRRGQAILYGPPGTGKTWHARRFVTWFLRDRGGDPDPMGAFADAAAFRAAEERLSTRRTERRTWWMVANPATWSWDELFRDGHVAYRTGRVQANFARVQPGDLVIGYEANPTKRIAAIARVRQGLHATPDGERIALEPVLRTPHGPTWDELRADPVLAASEPLRLRNQGTLFALTGPEADQALALLRERDPALDVPEPETEPGIGPITRVTFHPSYTYEDFVEGYRPVPSADGKLNLALEPGIFRRVCDAARAHPDRPYVLLIDEINRGNLAKVFGELMTLLEKDKRGLTVTLPQSRDAFSVPPNVYLLGTMNTADRSIRLLDAALRRRFAFVELMPDPEVLDGAQVGGLDLARFLRELNARIARRHGRERQVGHAYLLADGGPVTGVGELAARIRHEIIPLLQEYAYEDSGELGALLGTRIVDVDAQMLRPSVTGDAEALIAALAAEYGPGSSGA